MACIQCNINFDPSILVEESVQSCNRCNKVQNVINSFANVSYPLYHFDLQKKFKLIAPIFTGNELIMENPKFIDEGYTERAVISEITTRLDLLNSKYNDKQEIINVCNQIMGYLLDQINVLISDNPEGYLVSLLNLLEYNVHLTMITVAWMNDRENKIDIEQITDHFGRMVVRSLQFQKDINLSGHFEPMYKEWESVLSFDKLAFQYGIEILTHYSNKKQSKDGDIDPIKFGELIATIRAVYSVLLSRDMACDIKELIIDKKGCLITKERIDHDEFSKEYVEVMVGRRLNSLDETTKEKFNAICKKHIGVSLDDILKLINGLKRYYPNSDDFLIGSIEYFQRLIKLILQCSDEEIEKLFTVLLNLNNENFSFATSTSVRTNRPLRRCLIPIEEDIIACPVSVLKFSLMGLYMDIIEASLPDSPLQREVFKIVSTFVHQKFEEDVALHLKNCFPDAIVKGDIKENTIPDIQTEKFVKLSGQIDILMLYRNKIFVFDCKDSGLKFTQKAISNELQKFRKLSHDSYQTKLNNKVNDVVENWDSVLKFLGIEDSSNVSKHKPIALFVTDTLSFASFDKDLPNPVVAYSKLTEWINIQF